MRDVTLQNRFFLESHHYDGGLRFENFPLGSERPSWAPSPDRVGFRNEVDLPTDGIIVEFAQFSAGTDEITWLAVYRRSIDTQLGDRQNHAGVGVWLLNLRITNPTLLIKGLRNLSDPIALSGPGAVSSDIEQFVGPKFLPKYLEDSAIFPGNFRNSISDNGPAKTKLYEWNATFEKALPLIGCELFSRYSAAIPNSNENRVIFSCRERGAPEADLALPLHEIYSSFMEIIRMVPEGYREILEERNQLHENLEKLKIEGAGYSEREGALRRELADMNAKVISLEEEISASRAGDLVSPLVSQHLRKFEGQIDAELSSFGRNLQAIQNSIRQISHSNVATPSPAQPLKNTKIYLPVESPWTFYIVAFVLFIQVIILFILALPHVI